MPRRRTYHDRKSRGILLPGDMWDQLQDVAYQRDMSRNLLITMILREWLAEHVEVEVRNVNANYGQDNKVGVHRFFNRDHQFLSDDDHGGQ